MPGLIDFRHHMQVATRPTHLSLSFLSGKTRQNVKFVAKTTWHGGLNWSYKVMIKKWNHFKIGEKRRALRRSLVAYLDTLH